MTENQLCCDDEGCDCRHAPFPLVKIEKGKKYKYSFSEDWPGGDEAMSDERPLQDDHPVVGVEFFVEPLIDDRPLFLSGRTRTLLIDDPLGKESDESTVLAEYCVYDSKPCVHDGKGCSGCSRYPVSQDKRPLTGANCSEFFDSFGMMQRSVHRNAKSKGWWDWERNFGEAIALMHSELSEALEASRLGNPPSKKAEGYSTIEEELADVIIRIMDFAEGSSLDVAGAILAKHEFNKTRPQKHGKKF